MLISPFKIFVHFLFVYFLLSLNFIYLVIHLFDLSLCRFFRIRFISMLYIAPAFTLSGEYKLYSVHLFVCMSFCLSISSYHNLTIFPRFFKIKNDDPYLIFIFNRLIKHYSPYPVLWEINTRSHQVADTNALNKLIRFCFNMILFRT